MNDAIAILKTNETHLEEELGELEKAIDHHKKQLQEFIMNSNLKKNALSNIKDAIKMLGG